MCQYCERTIPERVMVMLLAVVKLGSHLSNVVA